MYAHLWRELRLGILTKTIVLLLLSPPAVAQTCLNHTMRVCAGAVAPLFRGRSVHTSRPAPSAGDGFRFHPSVQPRGLNENAGSNAA